MSADQSNVGTPEELEERLLAEQLNALGGKAGAAGGLLGGGLPGALGGGRGGGRGARRAARRMRTERWQLPVELPASADEVVSTAATTLSEEGTVLDDLPEELIGDRELWGIVGEGTGGLNPVVVRVAASPTAPEHSITTIRASAKQGLLKHGVAERTATRMRDTLEGTLRG